MSKKTKLELTWIGKENRPRLEPRILVPDDSKSYHAKHRVSDNDIFDNRLIFGDNLLALKALEQEFTCKVKCVYIDPPFNTGEAFEHYDDGVEHSIWLSLMHERLRIIHKLLSPDGSLFIHIDDTELAYLMVLCDEVFGRPNRINVITFKQSSASGPKSINPGLVTTNNYILYYAKDRSRWAPQKVFVPTGRDDRYSKFIENIDAPFQKWGLISLKDAFCVHHRADWDTLKAKFNVKLDAQMEQFVLDHAERVIRTARVLPKDVNEDARDALNRSIQSPDIVFKSERADKEAYFFLNGEQLLFYKNKTRKIDGRITTVAPATNLWDDLLSNNLHKEGGVSFPNGKKPEHLLKRVLEIATFPGDIVLDSFSGSGTTGAVAHKLGRRWIMIELGPHCESHIVPRMQCLIDGKDTSGITNAVGWNGGGGFRYYKLAPSLLTQDKWGQWVISKEYNAPMLAEAVCKHENFTYAPSDSVYWQQGRSTERDFIYTTTATLSHEQLQELSEEVGPERSLLVVCSAFRGRKEGWANLTVKKIPSSVLTRCEWGHDDYSLKVENLPKAPPPVPKTDAKTGQQSLFAEEAGK